jgi:Xaa-Pro aminopeptidase
MRTMHPVLVLGSYRWDQEWLPLDEFEERLRAVRAVMAARSWSGLIVHGNSEESALLTYLTNFYPRLRWTLALVPAKGDIRLLVAGATRDLPAAAMLTWVKDVGWYGNVDKALPEWIGALGPNPRIALAGLGSMRPAVHEKVTAHCKPEDADGALLPLLRRKRPRERQMLRQSAKILAETVAALEQDGLIAAERRARAGQAQAIRMLFSLDGGKTLKPFETPADLKGKPSAAYVAVRYLGYWSEAFVTLDKSAPARAAAHAALDAMLAAAKPGATGRDLARAAAPHMRGHAPHPMIGTRLGHAIGLSLDEAPVLAPESDGAIEAGGVYSLHMGLADAFASAMMMPDNNEILWRGR